ncbi:hypothetical protein E3N88_29503 [Mikania micrantha]|uniref:Uncharacterized protein n=1 Tax=Mikania micrantha TaxID=192012 RepID=A0A5N6MJ81_9ASTR|nr:hypothetical protein E3N88_29503 [Mikania micrantha]
MANQGERYIYQRFPYLMLDDTPSSSSGSDSDPTEGSSAASQATPTVPHTPSAPRSVTPPPPPPAQSASHGHSQPRAENIAAEERHSSSPQRVPEWDGLRRMRGQARKTTGLPPRHPLAPRDEPQGMRLEMQQRNATLDDTRNTVLEILTSHLTLMDHVNTLDTETRAWRVMVEERLRRTWRQRIVAAFWQQVEVIRAGVRRLREFLVWFGTVSFETWMIVLAVIMAALAMIFSCLSYFIR